MGELRASLLRCRRCGGVLPAALEPVAVAVHFQDMDVVGEPVQQGSGEPLRAEHVGPLGKRQVGGYEDGAPLVALAEDLEEQFSASPGSGTKPNSSMISRLRRDSCHCRLSSRRSSRASISSWTRAAAEAHRHAPLAGSQSQPEGHMGLAGAAISDDDDVLPVLYVLAAG